MINADHPHIITKQIWCTCMYSDFFYLRILHLLLIVLSRGCKVIFQQTLDAMVLQTCHEKWSSGLISLQLDSLIWETASPRIHKLKIVNESLYVFEETLFLFLFYWLYIIGFFDKFISITTSLQQIPPFQILKQVHVKRKLDI